MFNLRVTQLLQLLTLFAAVLNIVNETIIIKSAIYSDDGIHE